jgi:hypothetical protein
MEKIMKRNTSAVKIRDGYKIAGRSKDGVWILKPSIPPTHFSVAEARASVSKVLRDARSGEFTGSKAK